MTRKKIRKISALIFCVVIAITVVIIPFNAGAASGRVVPSNVDYSVDLNKSQYVYICNKNSLGSKVGTEYYMTYTVESLSNETSIYQSGVIGTNIPNYTYPYLKLEKDQGGLYNYNTTSRNNADIMMRAGNTYFMKFTITETGYKYSVAWANDDAKRSKYIEFENVMGSLKNGYTAFGLWIDAYKTGADGRLIKVRCYDKNGNDLGVSVTPSSKAEVSRAKPLSSNLKVDHKYKVTLKKGANVAISSKKPSKCSKVYMEYTVESSNSKPYQSGVAITASPKLGYPYTDGYMKYEQLGIDAKTLDNGPLLTPGAKYLIIFDSKDDSLDVTIQKSLNGKNTFVYFPQTYGKYKKSSYLYRTLWLSGVSESEEIRLNCVLNDFKCYDETGKNLGIMINTNGTIEHFGEKEEYEGCEAMYYCDADRSSYAMYADKTIKYTDDSGTVNGTYRIEKDILTVTLEKGENRNYNYIYQYFTDENNKKYRRLHASKLIFDTGKGSKVATQEINLENGFIATEPEAPTLKDSVFEGWYTIDGKKFEFGKVIPNSITVYAKWSGKKYIQTESSLFSNVFSLPVPYIIGAVIILAAAVIFIIKISSKGDKNET